MKGKIEFKLPSNIYVLLREWYVLWLCDILINQFFYQKLRPCQHFFYIFLISFIRCKPGKVLFAFILMIIRKTRCSQKIVYIGTYLIRSPLPCLEMYLICYDILQVYSRYFGISRQDFLSHLLTERYGVRHGRHGF